MATNKKTTRKSSKNISDVVDSVSQTPPQDEKARKVKAAYKEKAVADSASLTVEKVTQSLTKAGLDISKTLNSVRELFESEISDLQTIREAIEAKSEELEQLYDKEIVAAALTDLVLQYETQKAILEKQQEEKRQEWAKEQTTHAISIKERDDTVRKERTRENEEFEYNKNISRRNAEEAWRSAQAKRTAELQQIEDGKNKAWAEREEILKKKEAEVDAAKTKLDNFETLVQADVDKHVGIISNSLKSKFETEAKIKSLEFESEKKLLKHDNDILKGLVEARDREIAILRAALEKKDSEVKEVAVAAMTAQSGKQALAAVQESLQVQSGKK